MHTHTLQALQALGHCKQRIVMAGLGSAGMLALGTVKQLGKADASRCKSMPLR